MEEELYCVKVLETGEVLAKDLKNRVAEALVRGLCQSDYRTQTYFIQGQVVESYDDYDKEESDWEEIKKEFDGSIEELKSVLEQCIKGKKESPKDKALASIKLEMSRIEGVGEVSRFRHKVLDTVSDVIAYNTCIPLTLSGDSWQEEIVTEVLGKYRNFVTRRSGSVGRGSLYSIEIVSREE